jgi:uncharacterized protein (TIGR02145 family)
MNKIITSLLITSSFSFNAQLYTPGSGVTDIDGNTYQTIIINGQEWMAENLRTSKYANGEAIPNVPDSSQWLNLSSGAWVHFNDDSQNEFPFGKLYNWYTVADSRNLCPVGWQLPSDSEWTVLTDFLGGEIIAGGKMKIVGTEFWQSPNTDATNESGFSGIPAGRRIYTGPYYGLGNYTLWWSTTSDNDTSKAWTRDLHYLFSSIGRYSNDKNIGLSVRCVKNETSGINELKPTFKSLIRITDIMGRETVVKNNEVLFYLYSDGSFEKKVISE